MKILEGTVLGMNTIILDNEGRQVSYLKSFDTETLVAEMYVTVNGRCIVYADTQEPQTVVIQLPVGTRAVDRETGLDFGKKRGDVKVFVAKSRNFRARITLPGEIPYEVTVGGSQWVKGKGREYEDEILRKCALVFNTITNNFNQIYSVTLKK